MEVTKGFPDRLREVRHGQTSRDLAKDSTPLSVSPFPPRLRWVREHSSCWKDHTRLKRLLPLCHRTHS